MLRNLSRGTRTSRKSNHRLYVFLVEPFPSQNNLRHYVLLVYFKVEFLCQLQSVFYLQFEIGAKTTYAFPIAINFLISKRLHVQLRVSSVDIHAFSVRQVDSFRGFIHILSLLSSMLLHFFIRSILVHCEFNHEFKFLTS